MRRMLLSERWNIRNPSLILTYNTNLLAAEKLSNGRRPVLTLDQIGACPLL